MDYEEIWQKVKNMSLRDRKQLAYEVSLALKTVNGEGNIIGYVHPHYYFEAKAIHEILFYPPHSQKELEDKDGSCLQALKEVIEDDNEIHLQVRRYHWLPRIINDWRESKVVKSYITSRFNCEALNCWYQILPGKSLAGERPRSLFIWDGDGGEVVYKMTACTNKDGYEQMTFSKMEK